MKPARRATTVLLLRDTPGGPEVLMVRRNRNSGFLPNAWVFPGGRVDPEDALIEHPHVAGGRGLASAFSVPEGIAVSHAIAGIRETFEEAGLWLGDGEIPGDLRDALNTRAVDLGTVLTRHGARIDTDTLAGWSWWVTPEVEPKRYDTWFLAARAPDAIATHDAREVVDSRWVRPRQILAEANHEAFPLAPPTWWTLWELSRQDTTAAILAADRPASQPIQPVMEFSDGPIQLFLPGHHRHPSPAIPDLPDRITFDGGWIAWDGDLRWNPPV